MTLERPSPDVERRDRGLALADALLDNSRPLAPLTEVAHARVKRRLKASLRRSAARRPRWLQPVLISGVMLLCGGAFGIALDRLVLQRSVAPGETPSPPPAAKSRSRRVKEKAPAPEIGNAAGLTRDEAVPVAEPIRGKEASTAEPPRGEARPVGESPAPSLVPAVGPSASRLEPPAPAPTRAASGLPKLAMRSETARASHTTAPAAMPAGLPPPAPTAAPVMSAPVVAPVESAPPAQASPVVDALTEERLLAAAVRALRVQRDPPSALVALDEYRARYPHGRLAVEADVLRVDALVGLQRSGEALAALDRMELGPMPSGLERQLQRGELRASVGRWQDARSDFDKVIARARGLTRDLSERAFWGRAQSRARLGDKRGARADVDEYLRRFPTGRFAAQADRLVSEDEPRSR